MTLFNEPSDATSLRKLQIDSSKTTGLTTNNFTEKTARVAEPCSHAPSKMLQSEIYLLIAFAKRMAFASRVNTYMLADSRCCSLDLALL